MPFLIDGSNLGGRLRGRQGARDPRRVVDLLLNWVRNGRKVAVVFDGRESADVARRYGSLEVSFSGDRTADDVIIARLERSRAHEYTVVTADRELARRCRELGAEILLPTDLLPLLSVGAQPDGGDEKPSRVNVTEWEEYFRGNPRDE